MANTQEATAWLNNLPSDVRIGNVYFVGHGNNSRSGGAGFFWDGRDPTPEDRDNHDFETRQRDGQLFLGTDYAPSRNFAEALGRRLASDRDVSIMFRSCFTGQDGNGVETFLTRLSQAFAAANSGRALSAQVGAFTDYFDLLNDGSGGRATRLELDENDHVVAEHPLGPYSMHPPPQVVRTTREHDRMMQERARQSGDLVQELESGSLEDL